MNTDQIKQIKECPFCETGKSHLTIDKDKVTKNGKTFDWIVYKCDQCNEGFTTTESDTLCYAAMAGIELVQPEGFPDITPLPWHLSDKGFERNGTGSPTIYATNDDLEIIARVYRDRLLHDKVQNNLANAKYIIEACNEYPRLKKEIARLEELLKQCN